MTRPLVRLDKSPLFWHICNSSCQISSYLLWRTITFWECFLSVCFKQNVWLLKLWNGFFSHNCEFYHSKIEKQTHFPQKIYKLSKINWAKVVYFSLVWREREGKKPNILLLSFYCHCLYHWLSCKARFKWKFVSYITKWKPYHSRNNWSFWTWKWHH